jgi:membrane-associated phospholipid phosphatase
LVPEVIFSLPWAGVLASAIAGLINRYEKISLHAMGAGMLFGFIVAYYKTQVIFDVDLIIGVAILGGLIMSARMYLGKHTLRQSIMGYLLGFFTVFLMLTYFPSPNL